MEKRMGVLKRLFLFFILLFTIFVIIGGWQYREFNKRSIVDDTSSFFYIKSGEDVRTILRHLSHHPHVRPFSSFWFELFIRMAQKTKHIQAGEYQLSPGLTGREFVDKVARGQVYLHALTLVNGWTFDDIQGAMLKNKALLNTLENASDDDIKKALNILEPSIEGVFFPETYYFPRNMTDIAFLKRAYELMHKNLALAWSVRDENLPIETPYEALIMASIIEKESHAPEEWPIIARVFHNRLEKKMRLQADPTVIYGLKDTFDGNLTRNDLKKPTPYNTYTEYGLPPTPIAMPSFGAMLAACKPLPGDALYFVAKGDGTHVFSADLKTHQKWVNKYQIKGQNDKKS